MRRSVTALLAACGLALWQPSPAQPVPEKVRTLRSADAAAMDLAPEERTYRGKLPGSQKPIARTFSTQPPLIPHAVENLEEVTLQSNPCLMCHGPDTYKAVKAPKISDSHFRDRDGKLLPQVSAARYQCLACHVPQVDAKPLVQSTFRGDVSPAARKK